MAEMRRRDELARYRRVPGTGGRPEAEREEIAPRPLQAIARAAGEVPFRVRWWRAMVAAMSSMVAAVLVLLSLLLWLSPAPLPPPEPPPPVVEEDPVPPMVEATIRVRPRPVVRAAQPGPAVIYLPPERSLNKAAWHIGCPASSWGGPVPSDGYLDPGESVIRIGRVPPVSCTLIIVNGSASVKGVTAGSVKRCRWSGTLVCD